MDFFLEQSSGPVKIKLLTILINKGRNRRAYNSFRAL
jgi:hypothetical protein